jgi:hypothetical protein
MIDKKKNISLIFILYFPLFLIGQSAPDWLNSLTREQSYPAKDFYTGFVTQTYQKGEIPEEFSDRLMSAARAALSESIYVSVKGKSSSNPSNDSSEDRYQKSTVTSSSLEDFGMKTEGFVDKEKQIIYAFAFVKKKSLISSYYRLLSSEIERIDIALEGIKEVDDRTEAYKRYNAELTALSTAKSYQTMLKYLNVSSDVVLKTEKWKQLYDMTLDGLDKLRNNEDIGIKEASYFLVDKLKEEMGDDLGTIHMGLITYKSTDIATEFSDYFGLLFRQALEEKRGGISRSISKDGYVVSGSYWPGDKEIQIIANVNYVSGGENVSMKAGGSIAVDLEKVKRLGINYGLEEKSELLKKNDQMRPTSPVGGLIANITTQKGTQSAIFKEGELLSLSVSVSRPAYIRVINVWSDNQKFLLADNYYITPEQANLSVKLPLSWETSCPCGVEYIQMVAQDKPFEKLETQNVNGFDSIVEPLADVLEATRAVKKNSEYYAESTIILTTIK